VGASSIIVFWLHRGHCVLRIPVTEIFLNEPQTMAAIGKIEGTRMAQHLWPDAWQATFGLLSNCRN
jgi:hypothetical protein